MGTRCSDARLLVWSVARRSDTRTVGRSEEQSALVTQSPLCSCTRSTQAVNVKNLADKHSESQHTNFYNADIAMYESYQESQGEAYSSSLSPKKKGKGGRKKNLHPPPPTIMKHLRNMANARERKRMNGLNDAFERLREVVPNVNTEQKMSKIETLLVAQTYIKALAKLMDSVAEEEEDEMVSRISLRN